MREMNKMKLLQLLSRVWNGPNGVSVGKQAEKQILSILRNRFPKAEVIEVTDMSGKNLILYNNSILIREKYLKGIYEERYNIW